ncbi:MAG TPA: hypothetical protein VHB50_14875, partial [Bryobacteraceae bacterium]|nr:hypothetical protein [Bryobacteraceae bacterium]
MSASAVPVPAPDLSSSERQLVESSRSGHNLDLSSGDRVVRAEVIYDLCTGRYPDGPVHARGVRLSNAIVTGQLDFSGAQLLTPLYLTNCNFQEKILFRDARARTLSLEGSTLPGFEGERAEINGALALKNCRGLQRVRLSDSSIGVLNLEGAHIDGGEEFPLRADRIAVRGSVFLRRGFDCKGGVSLEDARIGGRLDCSEALIARTTSDALSAIGLDLKGMLDFSRARIKGRIRLAAAQIGGVALLDGSVFENGAETTLGADGAQFRSAVLFRNCNMQGTVSLAFASVAATLECDGGTFSAPSADCLRLTEVRTAGSIILSSTFEGLVDLEGAQAGGDLLAGPAVFRNPGKMAFRADGAVIRSSLRLDSVQVEGSVSLAVARVANSMAWQGATSVRGDVLAGEIAVQGHVITGPDLRVHGKFSMPGA